MWEVSRLGLWWQKRLYYGLLTLTILLRNGEYCVSFNNGIVVQKTFSTLAEAQSWADSEALRILGVMQQELQPQRFYLLWGCLCSAIALGICWLCL